MQALVSSYMEKVEVKMRLQKLSNTFRGVFPTVNRWWNGEAEISLTMTFAFWLPFERRPLP